MLLALLIDILAVGQGARADSFSYQTTAQVTPTSGSEAGVNSRLTGTFAIDSTGLTFNPNTGMFSGSLPPTGTFQIVGPDGTTTDLTTAGEFVGTASGALSWCGFAAGDVCGFVFELQGPGYGGFVVFTGALGGSLNVIAGGEAESSQLIGYTASGVFSEIHGSAMAVPEPDTLLYAGMGLLCMVALVIFRKP